MDPDLHESGSAWIRNYRQNWILIRIHLKACISTQLRIKLMRIRNTADSKLSSWTKNLVKSPVLDVTVIAQILTHFFNFLPYRHL
jgi:hypothetical protein